jgi:hypothetical protein
MVQKAPENYFYPGRYIRKYRIHISEVTKASIGRQQMVQERGTAPVVAQDKNGCLGDLGTADSTGVQAPFVYTQRKQKNQFEDIQKQPGDSFDRDGSVPEHELHEYERIISDTSHKKSLEGYQREAH